MYESLSSLVESATNHPWITLGIVILLFHLERAHNLIRYALIPHYNLISLLHIHVPTVSAGCTRIYKLSRSGMKNKQSTKREILADNIELSLPLVELRILTQDKGDHLLEKKVYDLIKKFLQKIESQYEYILLHAKCPSTLINPQELEQWSRDILNLVPRTFWDSARSHFRINFYHAKRGRAFRRYSLSKESFDGLFALGQAKKLKMFFLPRKDVPLKAKIPVQNYIKEIETAYLKKDEAKCVSLYKDMHSFLEEKKSILVNKKL